MASLVKRGEKYAVVYYYINEQRIKKQKWETPKPLELAEARKKEVEEREVNGVYIPPSIEFVSELIERYVEKIGMKKWGARRYDSCVSLIQNYIMPTIGEKRVTEIDTLFTEDYITILEKTKSVWVNNKKPKSEFLTPNTIENIIALLKRIFDKAVFWQFIKTNPFVGVTLPEKVTEVREAWSPIIVKKAIKACKKSRLFLTMVLIFSCSLRLGEALGITWNNVHVSKDLIEKDKAYIYIDKELGRLKISTMEKLKYKRIQFVFPSTKENAKTRLVLMDPKNKTSVRKIYLPKAVAYLLLRCKREQDIVKEILGKEYFDYNLAIALNNGKPCENRVIEKDFKKLKKKEQLPDVDLYSLRHSSIGFKLKLSHGDIKAVQGDSGHATSEMVTNVYAKIVDEDRVINAQNFQDVFFSDFESKGMLAIENDEPNENEERNSDLEGIIEKLKNSPELRSVLKNILEEA